MVLQVSHEVTPEDPEKKWLANIQAMAAEFSPPPHREFCADPTNATPAAGGRRAHITYKRILKPQIIIFWAKSIKIDAKNDE